MKGSSEQRVTQETTRAQAMVTAYYGLRRGGSGARSITSAAEAEKILRGGYGVTNVRLIAANGDVVGEREWRDIDGREQWFWWFDREAFADAP